MDSFTSAFNSSDTNKSQQHQQSERTEKKEEGGGGFFSKIGDSINTAAGGGKESEKNEDMLDKGIDFVQEHVMGKGPQNNESAAEQAIDEQESDYIRRQFKSVTGHEIPIKDKDTKWD